MGGQSLFEKVWNDHVVVPETEDTPAVFYIDLHIIHEVTTPQAFNMLRDTGMKVRRPDLVLATMDHSTPTVPITNLEESLDAVSDPEPANQIRAMVKNCDEFGIKLHGFGDAHRGIVHVIGPEIGATQPGKTIVCGDSHSSTHGAFGAMGFGIGATMVGHVMATQCLLLRKPKSMAVNITGKLKLGVSAKDIILALIGKIGVDGGTGHVIEYRGETIHDLNMEERMTICNMSIEAGARAGMIAPDTTTIEYLRGREEAPQGAAWDTAVERWLTLPSDPDATFDKEVNLDVSELEPQVTYGTNPGMVVPISKPVPNPGDNMSFKKSINYMQVEADKPMLGTKVDVVFVGSCTNSRMTDLRNTAKILKGRKVADNVRMMIVPGSEAVKQKAEAEGLHEIFTAAGADWREAGCSMCLGMNSDKLGKGQLCVSTSNRNFEGRQGPGGRTVLASPQTAAASAIAGVIADPRDLI
ncbi:MAG: 3-isopropylmalate dehydratase large subunit [Gammaproteobacteria bacterium]|nr:3-isopropylmalate dehydratase large subunit [Gammaproteobacteria bacterium]MCP4090552.1 3-isopropylmalate dehydratase large subunit [Gammaproteobacteria bacterium]MCP4276583.1 3-isopropylmalate dehydratase large subunit [Gammaproteobacteria bacterium]MCP4831351.1 3-isopropylmalate dehydratase large subunit [Gammaproteobacteria bacterium]MCP4928717.1 3-isopropylmalate dehydratase large subunit [Gammaproteobacteria bacterium]